MGGVLRFYENPRGISQWRQGAKVIAYVKFLCAFAPLRETTTIAVFVSNVGRN
jgi:hypothetical protein